MLKIAYDAIYQYPLPEGHRFPMLKYELIPKQLLYEGVITEQNLFSPGVLEEEIILLTHHREYLEHLKNQTLSDKEVRKIGFPLSYELYKREITILKGTIDCALYAMQYGVALNVAGGTHHAFAGNGEGFCLLNDFAVAANYLLNEKLAKRILIVDLDVHQGNGTAKLFEGDKRVFTFSMHGKHNYPFHKEKSDMDIELPDGITDEDYLSLLYHYVPALIQMHQPDIIFYVSGVDILATDKYGKLSISQAACKMRDEYLFSICKQHRIPIAVAMGGGYSPKIADIVNAHCNTFKAAAEIFLN